MIEWIEPEIPDGWTGYGHLPASAWTITLLEDDLLELMQDLFQVSKGEHTLDVGWYPDADLTGEFVCRIVRLQNWDEPVETYRTTLVTDVTAWLESNYARF